jgi:hypothetical protein
LHFTDAAAAPRLIGSESQDQALQACHFLGVPAPKLPKKQAKTGKNPRNQQKTCGNRAFPVDKALEKTQG